MTIVPSGVWPIDPNVTTGTDLADYLNTWMDAFQSMQASPTRPVLLAKGGVWAKTLGAVDIALMFFDGSADHEVGSVKGGNISFGGVTASTTAPTAATSGQAWIDITDPAAPKLKIWNGTTWVSALMSTGGTMTGDLNFGNDVKATFGTNGELQISHNGATGDAIIKSNKLDLRSDNFQLKDSTDDHTHMDATKGGGVSLYHNNAAKFTTSSGGVSVLGTVTATSYSGDGSGLSGVGGAKGGGSDVVFWENDPTVTADYTITNNKNAMSAGPITINNGVTVTIGDGETWTVV